MMLDLSLFQETAKETYTSFVFLWKQNRLKGEMMNWTLDLVWGGDLG